MDEVSHNFGTKMNMIDLNRITRSAKEYLRSCPQMGRASLIVNSGL
jgi:hypothetical protein